MAVARTLAATLPLITRRPQLFSGVAVLLASRLMTVAMLEVAKAITETNITITVSGLDGLTEASSRLEATLRAIMLKDPDLIDGVHS